MTLPFVHFIGWTPLMIASSAGHFNIAEFLIANNSEVNETNHTGLTALHYAVSKNHTNIVKLLIDKADVNAIDKYGHTPLHRAVSAEREGIIELLIEANADLDIKVRRIRKEIHLIMLKKILIRKTKCKGLYMKNLGT